LPIWEGTTNVLSLETLRALSREDGFRPFVETVALHAGRARDAELVALGARAVHAVEHAMSWASETWGRSQPELEAGARAFALTLGRSLALALFVEHAQWCLDENGDRRSAAAARRFADHGVDLIRTGHALGESRAVALGEELRD
jgi:hypothetical protein